MNAREKHTAIKFFARMNVDTLAKAVLDDPNIHEKNAFLQHILEVQLEARDYILSLENEDPFMVEAVYRVACEMYEDEDRVDFDAEICLTDGVLDMQKEGGTGLFLQALVHLNRKKVNEVYEDLVAEEKEGSPF